MAIIEPLKTVTWEEIIGYIQSFDPAWQKHSTDAPSYSRSASTFHLALGGRAE
ncbi:hypothetical protein M404DRAFT_1008809 [Pisolithus tinctorius Marx 270]|uniref:Uncharacterized protein n=1 Tax=Pisolithus tinctorius Marx 270 TaxID=870435 RepID=A0A0C3NCS5_PISTI|nr:hypothetical protein M404DRAFT_1008809 [Pisolithus tinctorius Marx 270]